MLLVSWCSAGGSVGTPVRWELWGRGLLNTGQGSVRGPGRPAAIFSLAVSNETAQGPRKKGLLPGHPALPEITPETRPTKEAFRGRSDTGTWHQILNLEVCFADKWKFPLPSPSQSERLGERNECQGVGWEGVWGGEGGLITQSVPHTTLNPPLLVPFVWEQLSRWKYLILFPIAQAAITVIKASLRGRRCFSSNGTNGQQGRKQSGQNTRFRAHVKAGVFTPYAENLPSR